MKKHVYKLLFDNRNKLKQALTTKVDKSIVDIFADNFDPNREITLKEFKSRIQDIAKIDKCADKETGLTGLRTDEDIEKFYLAHTQDILEAASIIMSNLGVDPIANSLVSCSWDYSQFTTSMNNKRLLCNFIVGISYYNIMNAIDDINHL